ncbi:MAG: hypothetical protein SFV19_13025 [Rhodospirillaceae bacterium]|nr:hypothetical protein [Rhodospirillaceae bacterium]
MLSRDQQDLLNFLTESAHALASQALTSARDLHGLLNEAEELIAIRENLRNRHWAANTNQLELPFAMKKAA